MPQLPAPPSPPILRPLSELPGNILPKLDLAFEDHLLRMRIDHRHAYTLRTVIYPHNEKRTDRLLHLPVQLDREGNNLSNHRLPLFQKQPSSSRRSGQQKSPFAIHHKDFGLHLSNLRKG